MSRGALLSLTPGGLGCALSPALMSNSTLATIQGTYPNCFAIACKYFNVGMGNMELIGFPQRITIVLLTQTLEHHSPAFVRKHIKNLDTADQIKLARRTPNEVGLTGPDHLVVSRFIRACGG